MIAAVRAHRTPVSQDENGRRDIPQARIITRHAAWLINGASMPPSRPYGRNQQFAAGRGWPAPIRPFCAGASRRSASGRPHMPN
jgi:hypothetical protein